MSRKDEIYSPALKEKKIPILTLDNKWHRLFTQTNPNKTILRLEEELNDLLKKQGKATTESKDIKRLKKKLMQEIVENAEGTAEGNNQKALKKMEDNKRLINECNERLTMYEDQLIELPGEIDRVNRELMLQTMDICYDTLKTNETEIEETAKWVAAIRVELKKRLIRKQEMEQMNQELYSYMHDIFGAEVIEIFDMKYGNYSVQAEAFTAETVKK
ncbi:MAG: hypothetical protein DBY33_01775 [Lachnospiraceae bacterium]|jgi:hypothetical protein|nr:MAG: hypothetical protein DBY33_01775 [Lachnospiraceae bacterium]